MPFLSQSSFCLDVINLLHVEGYTYSGHIIVCAVSSEVLEQFNLGMRWRYATVLSYATFLRDRPADGSFFEIILLGKREQDHGEFFF